MSSYSNYNTSTSGNAGPHNSNIMNNADPSVDSDRDTGAQYAPGATTTSETKGPHSSSLLNKLDPRVDSKTGNMTTKSSSHSGSKTAAPAAGSTTDYQDNIFGSGTAGGVGHNPTAPSGSTNFTGQSGAARTGENGMGESLRGGLNAAVDKTFGDEQGVAKNDMVAQQGERQMRTGNFCGY
ncbi:protein dprC [Aspergillus lucknowensis]|uniref:Uncharacterized protein n=1 Tax=Aspergillus lucknowensis TaxID=176173 RepID=A0ABR4LEN0_9EURO